MGSPLQALFQVLETQYELVQDNVWQLYDDQFIETCVPWVIPYIAQLIGYSTVYTAALTSPDSRAEVANTIGYRRRKGTLVALEQITHDVSGRATMGVEEFKRLVTTLSLRDVQPHNYGTANLRYGPDLEDQDGPFTRLNRTISVRNIAPRVLKPVSPDPTPLDITLHGGGRFNIPDIAVWMWRWSSQRYPTRPSSTWERGNTSLAPSAALSRCSNQCLRSPLPSLALLSKAMSPSRSPSPASGGIFAATIRPVWS
jgi:hypothetical protein